MRKVYGDGQSYLRWGVLRVWCIPEDDIDAALLYPTTYPTRAEALRSAKDEFRRHIEQLPPETAARTRRRGLKAFAEVAKVQVTVRLARK